MKSKKEMWDKEQAKKIKGKCQLCKKRKATVKHADHELSMIKVCNDCHRGFHKKGILE